MQRSNDNGFASGNENGKHPTSSSFTKAAPSGISGRWFVILSLTGVLIGSAGMTWLFQAWRDAYVERIEFGRREVVTAVEPLFKIVPNDVPKVDPNAWKTTVQETQVMLQALVASNLLDRPALIALGAEIRGRVATARPETVRLDLSKLWDEIARKAGPILVRRHPKPFYLQPLKTGSPAS